jgi:Uma2 family endonuclease
MSYEEFLKFADEDVHGEWVDGEVIVFMPATGLHQDLIGFLYMLLSWFSQERDLGKVRFAPFAMRLANLRWSREPDLLFVAKANLYRLTETRLNGPADLVIEIVSDESEERDHEIKRRAYQEGGIPDYWVLDPRPGHQRAIFRQLAASGVYEEVALDERGCYASRVLPGFWLDPEWLWQDPLPRPYELLPLILAGANQTIGKPEHDRSESTRRQPALGPEAGSHE